jgi:hypothetical protein
MLAQIHPSVTAIKMAEQRKLQVRDENQQDSDASPAVQCWDAIHGLPQSIACGNLD